MTIVRPLLTLGRRQARTDTKECATVTETHTRAARLGSLEEQRTAVRPGRKVQVALDTKNIFDALAAARQVGQHIDIIEIGTVLCLAEGMRAVREMRACYPDHLLLADIRVAEAGSILSRLAFEAGADLVSVVSGAAPESFAAVVDVAAEFGGDVQVELSDGWTWALVEKCRDLGIRHFILHRSRDAEARGELSWSADDLASISRIHELGGRVSVTGGMSVSEVPHFAAYPVEIFIAGRALYDSADPAASAWDFRAAVANLPSLK
ncbi:orotidine 5'-phosphate decarboxylase / HUMPS family protein [Amycolatopsis balhimycina]|uniref:orotidine 5'-phosphate decarboxylase / HUMPS family protein n=1 Tax=Amycolatopsis balhimycina TaxID=208443 RepID=UPI00146E03ED|nr:orotidine 5'-phosphate decarboxylase / HUMPS family protein [Amycolatopsis balhimycina]